MCEAEALLRIAIQPRQRLGGATWRINYTERKISCYQMESNRE